VSSVQCLSLTFADEIPVPQGTKVNQLRALVRKHRAELLGDTVSATAASAFGAATSNVGSGYVKATDSASKAADDAFNAAINTWSETRLKAYLDARGVVSFSPAYLLTEMLTMIACSPSVEDG